MRTHSWLYTVAVALLPAARAYSSYQGEIPNGYNVPGASGVGHTSTWARSALPMSQ